MNATFQPCIVNFILQADSRYVINFVFSFGTCSKLLRHSKKVVRNKKIAKVDHGSDSPFVCNNKNHWKGENYDVHELMNIFFATYLLLDPKLACLYVFANNIIFFFQTQIRKVVCKLSHILLTQQQVWQTMNGRLSVMARLVRVYLMQTWDFFSLGTGEETESRNLTTTHVSLTV